MRIWLLAFGVFVVAALVAGPETGLLVAILAGLLAYFLWPAPAEEKPARPARAASTPEVAPSGAGLTRFDALALRVAQLEREMAELRQQLAERPAPASSAAELRFSEPLPAVSEPVQDEVVALPPLQPLPLDSAAEPATPLPEPALSAQEEAGSAPLVSRAQPVAEAASLAGSASKLPETDLPPAQASPASVAQRRPAVARTRRPAEPDLFQKAWHAARNWLLGGNTVVRVGILILFFGVAFLLKYAADSNLLPIELRLAGVALGACALLFTGWRLREKRRGYGLILQGGGVGMLYITAFVTLKLFNLLPAGVVLVFLVVLAVLSALLAIRQDARSLAVMGITGGFLAPLLTSTGGGNHVMLFSYYALLNAGIFGMAWFKSWRSLNVLGFAFTFGVATLWGVLRYEPALRASTLPFLVLFFAFYLVIAILYALHRELQVRHYVDGTLVFGTPLLGFGLLAKLLQGVPFGLAWGAVALGALYLGLTFWLKRAYPQRLHLLAESFLALGVIFATLAIPLAFDGQTTAAMWAVEGAAIVWISLRQQRMLALGFALLLQVLAAGAVLLHWSPAAAAAMPVFNGTCMASLLLALSALTTAFLLQGAAAREWLPACRALAIVFAALGGIWWFVAGLSEMQRLAAAANLSSLYLLFTTLSLVLAGVLAQRLVWPDLRWPVLALPVVLAAWSLYLLAVPAHPLANWGWLVLPLAYAAGWLVLKRHEEGLPGGAVLHLLLVWSLSALLARETAWQLQQLIPEGIWLYVAIPLACGLILLLVSLLMPKWTWPVQLHRTAYLLIAPLPLLLAQALWFVFALASNGDPAPLAYLPLLNPLDVAVGLTLLSVLVWLRLLAREQLWRVPAQLPAWLLCASLLPWLSSDILRLFHHWNGMDYGLATLLGSLKVQAVLVLFWSGVVLVLPGRLRSEAARQVVQQLFAALLALMSVWALLANLSDGQVLALAYIPFFNLLELAQLAAIGAVYGWWRQDRTHAAQPGLTEPAGLPGWLLHGGCLALFLLLNAALLRASHAGWQVEYSLLGIFRSTGLQQLFVLLWLGAAGLGLWLAWRERESRLLPVAGGLLLLLWLWSFHAHVADSGGRMAVVPLLNPLDLLQAMILVLLGVWFWLMARQRGAALLSATALRAFFGLSGFVWLNAVLLRTVHHWTGVPYVWRELMQSMVVQTALSLFWTVLALLLMVLATRRSDRAIWSAGAALLVLVVGKLFVLDLSQVTGIARIVSFIGVGVLLLLIGYLAPLPPASRAREGREQDHA
ncbi:DUF2339 domain-containing protein [Chitinilyticum litopenaei]|uniref:DUF2339 domain-containing protein n=1 Tax=Chitinilyticum litopenaei TaxID=1121276 RepID=UPI00041F70BA|nr:DUF2339 domain-containing protein [Chitinilyticum litopenaei]